MPPIKVRVKWRDLVDAVNNLPEDRDFCPEYVELDGKLPFNIPFRQAGSIHAEVIPGLTKN